MRENTEFLEAIEEMVFPKTAPFDFNAFHTDTLIFKKPDFAQSVDAEPQQYLENFIYKVWRMPDSTYKGVSLVFIADAEQFKQQIKLLPDSVFVIEDELGTFFGSVVIDKIELNQKNSYALIELKFELWS